MLKNITCPTLVVEDLSSCSKIPLASSFHDFKSPALAEAYNDSDLTPVGAAFLEDIAGLKDQLTSSGFEGKYIKRLAPNKSGHYYLSKLSRGVRKAFVKNTVRENKNLIPLTYVLRSDYENMEDFIAFPFIWTDTPEGFDYWDTLNDRMRWVTNILNK